MLDTLSDTDYLCLHQLRLRLHRLQPFGVTEYSPAEYFTPAEVARLRFVRWTLLNAEFERLDMAEPVAVG